MECSSPARGEVGGGAGGVARLERAVLWNIVKGDSLPVRSQDCPGKALSWGERSVTRLPGREKPSACLHVLALWVMEAGLPWEAQQVEAPLYLTDDSLCVPSAVRLVLLPSGELKPLLMVSATSRI